MSQVCGILNRDDPGLPSVDRDRHLLITCTIRSRALRVVPRVGGDELLANDSDELCMMLV